MICSRGSSQFTPPHPHPHHHRWGAAAATPSSNFKQIDFYLEITSGCSFSPSSSVLIQNNGYGSTEALAKTQCSATQPLFTGHDVVVLRRCLEDTSPTPCLAGLEPPAPQKHFLLSIPWTQEWPTRVLAAAPGSVIIESASPERLHNVPQAFFYSFFFYSFVEKQFWNRRMFILVRL